MDGQNAHSDKEKHSGEMMLLAVFLKRVNFVKSGNRETQIRKCTSKQKERPGKLFIRQCCIETFFGHTVFLKLRIG